LDELVMELLVDDPRRRLPSAAEFHRRLSAIVTSRGTQKVPTPEPLIPGSGFLDRAAALLAEGKKEEAREAAAQASLHSTGLVPALELYARLSDELGYTEDAISAFKRLVRLERTPAETLRSAQAQLADIFLRLHRYEDAEKYVEALIKSNAVPRATLFKAAVVLGACTRLDRALELLDQILAEDRRNGAALEKKAWVLWLLHRYEDAARVARDALEIMPDSELCLQRLIDYETLSGNHRRADYYRRQLEALSDALQPTAEK
jgi:tetratricopeptide (TPR) repeat protein